MLAHVKEILRFSASAAPIVLFQFALLLVITLTVMRIGSVLGSEALAGISLGNLTFNLTGFSLIQAPIMALETIAPQAFGAGRKSEVGIACQRALVIGTAILLPASLLWWHAEPMLLTLGQTPEVARLAARFLRGLLPALPALLLIEVVRRFLYAQDLSWPPFVAAAIGVIGHIVWLGPCVNRLGYDGGAVALVLTFTTMLLALLAIVFVRRSHDPATWSHCGMGLFHDRRAWIHMLSLSAASLVNLSEW